MKRVFFLNFAWEEGKITQSWLVVRLPGNSWCYREVGLKIFCNNGVSFRDSRREIYKRIKRQERKRKHEEKHGVLEERFQKMGEWKQLPSKDFILQRDDDGNEFLTFAEEPTKTRQGGLSVKTRLVTPKSLPQGMRKGVPSCCSNGIWGSDQAKWRKAVRFTSLSSSSRFQAFGTRKPQWERTP